MEGEAERRILHCDMDCFYAAVHMRDDPSLRGRPLVVGGSPEGRGVVAAANYEARRFGIHSAMPAAQAKRRCPGLLFLRPDFARYREESRRIFAIFREITEVVQPASLDEAWLDVSAVWERWGSATATAERLRGRVREECGLTVSVGVAPNRLVAKIASDFDKPDGLTVVRPREVEAFLAPLPVRRLHGVGPATERALGELGVATIADLRRVGEEALSRRFGRHGALLHAFAWGRDERPVRTHQERKSLGSETTYDRDLVGVEVMDRELARLAEEVAEGLARRGLLARTTAVKVRYGDFTTLTRSHTWEVPHRDADRMVAQAKTLLRRTEAARRPVRLLGVTASNLVEDSFLQLPLF